MQIKKNTISLLGISKIVSAGGGLLFAYLVIRLVGSQAFGNILVAISILYISYILCELSIFQSMAYVAVKTSIKYQQQTFGNSILCLLVVGLILTLTVNTIIFLFSNFIDYHATLLMSNFWYLTWMYPIVNWIEQIFKSLGQINRLALFHVLNRISSIGLILVLSLKSSGNIEEIEKNIYIIIMTSPLLATILVTIKLRPRISGIKLFCINIFHGVKNIGLDFIILKQANQLVYSSDKILISYFAGAAAVAHYAVAVSFGSILMILSSSSAQDRFRSYFKRADGNLLDDRIDKIMLRTVLVLSLVSAFLITKVMYNEISSELIILIIPALLGTYFQAAYQLPNSWLLAKGREDELKKVLFGSLISNMVGNFTLIPFLGAFGACCATLIGNFIYYKLAKESIYNVTKT